MPICPSCRGSGKLFAMFPHYVESVPKNKRKRAFSLPCDRCKGTGKVSRYYKKWMADGEILKDRRIKKLMTLRKAAKLLRMYCVTLSQMERGIIKPNLSIHYDTIKVIRR